MSEWKKRKNIFIPDMQPPKTYKCGVCESKIVPNKNNRYVVKERLSSGGIGQAMSGVYTEPAEYDAFDCPVCGCQMVAKKRLRRAEDE